MSHGTSVRITAKQAQTARVWCASAGAVAGVYLAGLAVMRLGLMVVS